MSCPGAPSRSVAVERRDERRPVEHQQRDRDADDRQLNEPRETHPDGRGPPADENEPEAADRPGDLRPSAVGGLCPALLILAEPPLTGARAERQDRWQAVDDPDAERDADDRDERQPGDRDRDARGPPADEQPPDEADQEVRSALIDLCGMLTGR